MIHFAGLKANPAYIYSFLFQIQIQLFINPCYFGSIVNLYSQLVRLAKIINKSGMINLIYLRVIAFAVGLVRSFIIGY